GAGLGVPLAGPSPNRVADGTGGDPPRLRRPAEERTGRRRHPSGLCVSCPPVPRTSSPRPQTGGPRTPSSSWTPRAPAMPEGGEQKLVSRERAANEHGFADPKNWRILAKVRMNPRHATDLLRAPLVLIRLHVTR